MLDDSASAATPVKSSLGKYLASIRADRQLTLRQVEEATNKEVSNAYLSQIENEKILKPSPNVLHALSETYSVSYELLMQLAGYITAVAASKPEGQRHGRLATFAEHNLTPDEENELMRYLQFIRNRTAHGDKS
jgi:HTH-type transcriptional regulator, competence development regulator